MNVARTIKKARENLGLTQNELADKLEVSVSTVGNWEIGGTIPADRIADIASVLGLNGEELAYYMAIQKMANNSQNCFKSLRREFGDYPKVKHKIMNVELKLISLIEE